MDDTTALRQTAIARFQAANADDPRQAVDNGRPRPQELVDAERLAAWVQRLAPQASEALTLASHCQHLRRWEIPRDAYEAGRVGYLKWRRALGKFHADQAEGILRDVGYDEATIARVRSINLKQGLPKDADAQTMEDALCLSFIEHEIDEFASRHDSDKMVVIIEKTWRKMSDQARQIALTLPLSEAVQGLVTRALAGESEPPARPALQTLRGGCHCAAVRFEIIVPEKLEIWHCNCSICTMTGFEHVIVERSHFRQLAGADRLLAYSFNTGVAKHLFCSACGIKSYYVPRSHPEGYSVNARCLEGYPLPGAVHRDFDGQNWEHSAGSLPLLSED
jgi:hypothetical protein